MLWRRCSNVEATSSQRWRATLSQCRKLTSVQLSFSTVPQRCDNVNNDVVTTLWQRCDNVAVPAGKVCTHLCLGRGTFSEKNHLNCIELLQENDLIKHLSTLWNLDNSPTKMSPTKIPVTARSVACLIFC